MPKFPKSDRRRPACLSPISPRQPTTFHSRGYLPHFDEPGRIQSITFRLHDSLPARIVTQWRVELGMHEHSDPKHPICLELRRRIALYQDRGVGACYLSRPDIALMVEDALLHFNGQRYRLLAWCIMPNHVHVLIETLPDWQLSGIIHSWKSFTAKEANRLLNRKGVFWFHDYFDRFIRNEAHLRRSIEYIENNPVKARLCNTPQDWRFSSARRA